MREVQANGVPVRVGLLGCGNVGGALATLIVTDAERIATRTGVHLELSQIAVQNTSKPRPAAVTESMLTHDAAAVVDSPDVDVIVEVMGGIEPARTLILDALKAGKPVVTGNKELLAALGDELFQAASAAGVDLLFEASVAGAIPLIRPLRESLAGERITRIMGIVNGTTNFILTQMEAGHAYGEALAEAQSLGFAERDPTADVEGYDASAKVAIIATVAFGQKVVAGDVAREGISKLTTADFAFARKMGFAVKLLGLAERHEDGTVSVRVHPTLVPAAHPLASVHDSYNAVFIEGEAVGELMFYGRGAGGAPSASAVLGDLIDAAHGIRGGAPGRLPMPARARIRPFEDLSSPYYVSLLVRDQPGVLATVAGVFGRHGVSIRTMEQEGVEGQEARIDFITHMATERDVQATLAELRTLRVVDDIGGLIRVIGAT